MTQLSVDQVISSAVLGLDWGLSDLLYAEIGGRRVVYALSRTDEKLVEIEMAADGTLSVIGELGLNGPFEVGSTPALELFDGMISIAGLSGSVGQFITLDASGGLGTQISNPNVGELSAPEAVGLALVSANATGDGLVSYRDIAGSLTLADSLIDDASTYLRNVSDTAAITVTGTDYLAAVSGSENGITLVQVNPDGSMSAGSSFGPLDGLAISQPSVVEVIQQLNEIILVVGAYGSSSLSTLRIDENADIWLSDHILDSNTTRFQAVSTVDTISVGDFAYVAAGGADGGVSLLTVLPGGRLVHLATLADNSTTTLYRTSAISMSHASGALQIIAGSAWESGLTRLSYDLAMQGSVLLSEGGTIAGTELDDQIIGSDTADTIDGGAGADILFDGHGQDVLTGGVGADLFVFSQDGVEDVVLDFERGTDRLDLSEFDFLYDTSQISFSPEADGAVLTFAGETLRLHSEDGGTLTAADFANEDILNVDRPPMLRVSQTLEGGSGADVLNGNTGNDTISGREGDDVLSGGGGNDHIFGDGGADTLDGGDGEDVLEGGVGADHIVGRSGNDLIDGGGGSDIIYGDEIA